ncbi:RNA12 protein-domain-containing protein [Sphaerosporella brunnea]|uniref:Mitochondrial escape protein 2 n=1 Tax=Sphaerosporella brunnea TaxID=1250544 RepID=A0A5J5F0I5_9PEZI|nr:RNA12 protein-domain-containing protein [Sphaerosporella brunnea]
MQSEILATCIPESLKTDASFSILDTIPRPKDGGAFVRFRAAADKERVNREIGEHLKAVRIRRWFSRERIRTFPVRGKPWFEDMNRFPSKRLRVEFMPGIHEEGAPVSDRPSQETLHSLFRRYGKIADIIPQPALKEAGLPKATVIKFRKIHCATAARKCLDGFLVPHEETVHGGREGNLRLRIVYAKSLRLRWIGYWVTDNPRIAIPLIIVLFGVVVYVVFDPLREFFVIAKITGGPLPITRIGQFLEEMFNGGLRFTYTASDSKLNELPEDTKNKLELLKEWMLDTAVVVHGPRRGKRKLIGDYILEHHENVLLIDCKPIAEAPGDNATVEACAREVGYPVLPAFISDLTVSAGLRTEATRQSFETQLDEVLQVTRSALKKVALRNKNYENRHLCDEVYFHDRPEKRPVIVIDNFLHRETDNVVHEKLAEFAAQLVEDKHANVIFLTNDSASYKSLPDRLFRTVLLDDGHTSTTRKATDNALARDVLGLYVLQNRAPKKREWTPEQAWYFVKELAQHEKLNYDRPAIPIFRRGRFMNPDNGRPETIKPRRTHLRAAFKKLTEDRILGAKIDLQSLHARCEIENLTIARMEEELERLSKLVKLRKHPKGREEYLLENIEKAQQRIRAYEAQMKDKRRVIEEDS